MHCTRTLFNLLINYIMKIGAKKYGLAVLIIMVYMLFKERELVQRITRFDRRVLDFIINRVPRYIQPSLPLIRYPGNGCPHHHQQHKRQ